MSFDICLFQRLLKTKFVGRYFLHFEETGSTMDVASNLMKSGNPSEGTLILAEYQTAGRGRVEGRKWEAGARKNLLFTILLNLPIKDSTKLILAVPSSVALACRALGLNAWVKWPNDVWIGGNKVSGMLITSSVMGEKAFQAVGIGINVNEDYETPEHPQDARSLFNFLKKETNREALLASICNHLERMIGNSFDVVYKEYLTLEKLIGRKISVAPKLVENPERKAAQVVGYDEYGHLLVKYPNDTTESLSHEEVTIRPDDISDLKQNLFLVNITSRLISGTWKNELGSTVEFNAEGTTHGPLTGTYYTIVGNTRKPHPLYGGWTATDNGAVLSFSVAWDTLQPSASAWSGSLKVSPHLEITTTWTLTSDHEAPWKSVLTNKDTFKKLDVNSN